MTGKEKCKTLKEIRAKVAELNGIKGFEYKECPFDGECTGTCPACDAEVEALQVALEQKKAQRTAKKAAEITNRSELTFTMGIVEPPEQTMGYMVIDPIDMDKEIIPFNPIDEHLNGSDNKLFNEIQEKIVDREPGRIVYREPNEDDILDNGGSDVVVDELVEREFDATTNTATDKVIPTDKDRFLGEIRPARNKLRGKIVKPKNNKPNRIKDNAEKKPRGLRGILKKKNND